MPRRVRRARGDGMPRRDHVVSRRGRDARRVRPVLPAAEPAPTRRRCGCATCAPGRAAREELHAGTESRTNIWVDPRGVPGTRARLASTDVSAVFEALDGTPIIVERAMYLTRPGPPLRRRTTRAPASPTPATRGSSRKGPPAVLRPVRAGCQPDRRRRGGGGDVSAADGTTSQDAGGAATAGHIWVD